VLGLLLLHALHFYQLKWISLIGYSLLIVIVYALTDELHQYYVPGRAFEISDLLIDTFGAMIGIALLSIFYSQRRKINES